MNSLIFVEEHQVILENDILTGKVLRHFSNTIRPYTPCYLETLNWTEITKEEWIENIWSILYLVLHTIDISQSLSQFLHGNLHIDNIGWKEWKEELICLRSPDLEMKNILKKIPIIVSFDSSSFYDQGKRYKPIYEPKTLSGSSYDGKFDMITLFYSVLEHFSSEIDLSFLENLFLSNPFKTLENYFQSKDPLENIQTVYKKCQVRPLHDILDSLHEKVYVIQKRGNRLPKYEDPFANIKLANNFIFKDSRTVYENIQYQCPTIPFFTHQNYSNTLNVHILTIQASNATFFTKPRKNNLCDFINETNAIACINAGYFDLSTADSIFKNNITLTPSPIDIKNHSYQEDYGAIRIGKNGNLIIDNQFKNLEDEIIVGPLLFLNGKQTNLIEKLGEKRNGIYRYSCSDDTNDSFHKSNNIQPGDLYHTGNPNPRSILAKRGEDVLFILIEGRTIDYKGASIDQMYNLLSYLKVDDAINLDGGRSSLFLFRKKDEIISPIPIHFRKTVGSVIGCRF